MKNLVGTSGCSRLPKETNTSLETIASGKHKVTTKSVTRQRGVLQGDTMSPFSLSTLALRDFHGCFCGKPTYRERKVTHAFHIDNLYVKNAEQAYAVCVKIT